jgi:hypothetical protein
MSQQDENKVILSKKGRREMSAFIGHELLYDYSMGSLDSERRAAVADHIKFSRDAQLDLEKIQNGHKYATELGRTLVSQAIVERVNTPSTYLSVLMQKTQFEKWPLGLKWGLEAMLVVLAMVLVLSLAPWQKVFDWSQGLSSKGVILAEATRGQTAAPVEDRADFVDEGIPATAGTDKNNKVTGKNQMSPSSAPVTESKAADKDLPQAVAKEAPPVRENLESSKNSTTKVNATSGTTTNSADGGFLYRGQFEVTNLGATGAKITEKIGGLGGRKAGAVELGWKKTPTSMYYHFTIPEGKYQELVTFLQTFGNIKMTKEKHPRVMPEGIIRVIFTVDEGQQ